MTMMMTIMRMTTYMECSVVLDTGDGEWDPNPQQQI